MNKKRVFDRLAKRFEKNIKTAIPAQSLDKLKEFLCDSYGKDSIQNSPEHNEWLYGKNPSNIQYTGWDKDEVTGCQTALGCEFTSPAGNINGAWAMDLYVRDDWRMKGLGVALIKKVVDNNDFVAVLGVSPEAKAMFTSMDWKELGHINCYIKPLSALGFSNVQEHKSLTKRLFFSTASICIKTLTRLQLSVPSPYKHKRVVSLNEHTQELNALFSEQQSGAKRIQSQKTIENLQWRFFESPNKNSSYDMDLLYKDGILVGYVVSKLANWQGKKVLAISDYYGPESLYNTVIQICERNALKANAEAILYQGLNPSFEAKLTTSLFAKKPYGDLFMIYCSEEMKQKDYVQKRDNWLITFADNDMDFMFF